MLCEFDGLGGCEGVFVLVVINVFWDVDIVFKCFGWLGVMLLVLLFDFVVCEVMFIEFMCGCFVEWFDFVWFVW